jgi:hypothetical protein
MKHQTLLLVAVASTMFACGTSDSTDPAASTSSAVGFSRGTQFTAYDNPYGDGRANPLANIVGSVDALTVTAEDVQGSGIDPFTNVTLMVYQVPAHTAFAAHVHAKPCAPPDKGGGHYQNVAGGAVDETNEVHLDFMSNGAGIAARRVTAPFAIRQGGAHSVVIHDLAKDGAGKLPKLACVDVDF